MIGSELATNTVFFGVGYLTYYWRVQELGLQRTGACFKKMLGVYRSYSKEREYVQARENNMFEKLEPWGMNICSFTIRVSV